ncbi:MAG: acyltransferase [Rhizobium sp.]|nr:acyltransferase [Rhizobium sp.]
MHEMTKKSVSGTVRNYRSDIDGLRALAVVAVIIFHYFPTWLPGGLVGVDIFFVISGYLISGHIVQQMQTDRFSLLDFYSRRVRRIFPALIVVLIFSLCFGWMVMSVDAFGLLGKHVAGGADFVANLVLWAERGGGEGESNFDPMLHLWSLGVEEQFYILWPLVAWFAWRRGMNVLGTIAMVAFLSMIANLVIVNIDRVSAFYLPVSRFWELLAGAALVEVERQYGNMPNALTPFAAVTGLILLGLSFALIRVEQAFPGVIALAPVAGAVLVIAAGRDIAVKRLVFSNRFAIAIGLISYPLYLWHWPLVSFAYVIEGGTPDKGIRIALLALAFLLAALTYFLIEKPIRFGMFKRSQVALPLCAAMAITGLFGIGIYVWAG